MSLSAAAHTPGISQSSSRASLSLRPEAAVAKFVARPPGVSAWPRRRSGPGFVGRTHGWIFWQAFRNRRVALGGLVATS